MLHFFRTGHCAIRDAGFKMASLGACLGGLNACCFYLFLEVAGRQFVLRMSIFFQSARGHRKWCWCSNIQWPWFAYSPCLNSICFVSVLKKWVWVVPLCVQSCKNQHVHLLKVSVPQKNQRNLHFPPIMASSVGGHGIFVIVHHPEMAMKNPGSRGGVATWHRFLWGTPFDAVWIPKQSWLPEPNVISPWVHGCLEDEISFGNRLKTHLFSGAQKLLVSGRVIKKRICDNAATLTILLRIFLQNNNHSVVFGFFSHWVIPIGSVQRIHWSHKNQPLGYADSKNFMILGSLGGAFPGIDHSWASRKHNSGSWFTLLNQC